jgi:chromosomal replication initiation ATPase DnaA
MEDLLEIFKDEKQVCICNSCNRPYIVERKTLNPYKIVKSISKYYDGIDLREKTRKQTHVVARQIAFKILHTYTNLSLKDCAAFFAPATKDHTTALHGISIINDRIKYEDRIAEDYNNIIELIIHDHDLN